MCHPSSLPLVIVTVPGIKKTFTFDLWIDGVNYRELVICEGDLDEQVIDALKGSARRNRVVK